MTTQDTTGKKFMRETDARILIDRRLREADWDIENKNHVSTEETSENGRADYILKDSRGRAIAVIEAKRFSVDPASAKQQALSYAESINAGFIFLSNGEEIYFWDYKYRPEQKVATFFSQRDLEKIQTLRLEQKPLSVIPIPEKYYKGSEWRTPRPYQKEAMQIMDKALLGGKRKMLLVMATGTGKTDTIALYLKRLFEAGLANRALFLVDRIDLGVQTKEVFDEILKDYPSKLLYGGKQRDESSIIISTLPTLYSQLSLFTSGYFDVIISDEAHRSIFGIYNGVLSHFDAIRIGMTATPSGYVDRNTYKLFGCWDETEQKGKPTFVYGIRRGVKDGFLAGYDIVQIDTKVSLEGVNFEGEDYSLEDLERKINILARNEQVVQAYFAEEEKREPAGKDWGVKKIKDVATVGNGGTPSTKNQKYWNGKILWLTPKELSGFEDMEIFDTERKISDQGLNYSSAALFPTGTVLFTSRAPIGYIAIAGVPMATNQGFKNFVCDSKQLNNKFLYFFLRIKKKYLQSLGRGATFTEVSKTIVEKVEIPLPPLGIQKQIVAKLSAVQDYKKQLLEQKSKLKELFNSALAKSMTS